MKNLKYSSFFWFVFLVAIVALSLFLYSPPQETEAPKVENEPEKQITGFQPNLLSWEEATSSFRWRPRDSAASAVFKNKMWTMGGLDGGEVLLENHVVRYWEAPHFNDIWYSEDGLSWNIAKEHAEWPVRRSMSVIPFKDKLWMFGGWSPITGYTSDVWQSDDGAFWKKVVVDAPWPAREGQSAEVFQGKLWFFGGVNYDERKVQNDVWYSEDGLLWSKATATIPWFPRWDHATAIFNGKIFLAGGMNLSGDTFGDVWSSADGLVWELVTSSPSWRTRQGHSLAVFHGLLWIVGRLNDGILGDVNDIWYSSDGAVWQKTDSDPPWMGREDHSTLVFNERIYIFGGMGSDWRWKNDVWFSSK